VSRERRRVSFSARAVLSLVILGVLLAASGASVLVWSMSELTTAQAAHSGAVQDAARRADARKSTALKVAADRANSDRYAAEVAADAAADSAAEAAGFSRGPNGVYYRLADAPCSAASCVHLEVRVRADCSTGVRILGTLLRASVSIGSVEGSTAGVAAGETALVELAVSGNPDRISVTDARCLG
jgi:hypothetical protein